MSQCRGNTFLSTVVEGYHATIRQRQLDFALTLLTRNLTRHRAVNLIGEPVLAGHSLQLKNALKILIKLFAGYSGLSG